MAWFALASQELQDKVVIIPLLSERLAPNSPLALVVQ